MKFDSTILRRWLSLALCALLVLGTAVPAFADDLPIIEEEDLSAPAAEAPAEVPEAEEADEEEAAVETDSELTVVSDEEDDLSLDAMDSDSDYHNRIDLDYDKYVPNAHYPFGQPIYLHFKAYSYGVYSGEYYRIYIYDANKQLVVSTSGNFDNERSVRNVDIKWTPAAGRAPGLYYFAFEAFPKVTSTNGRLYPFYIDPPANLPKINSIDTLNNQCIRVAFDRVVEGANSIANYNILNQAGTRMSISGITYEGSNVYKINFNNPLDAGNYTLRYSSGSIGASADFRIYLDLRIYKVVDDRNVIVQLSDAIIGCTTPNNYVFHTLSGEVINITSAVSAYYELNASVPNVFRLTTAKPLKAGTTYVVETRNMFQGPNACQGTIAYFTPSTGQLNPGMKATVTALTNNQSICIQLPTAVAGAGIADNYIVKNNAGIRMPVGNVRSVGANAFEINFSSPLKADHYTITSQNMSEALHGNFDITLDLSVLRIEGNSVIIQLNEPIYGCTTPNNYFVHRLGSSDRIAATDAYSVFEELGSSIPNVFRIVLPTWIEEGQTFIIETRAMSLDAAGTQPCQGTIGYFTK